PSASAPAWRSWNRPACWPPASTAAFAPRPAAAAPGCRPKPCHFRCCSPCCRKTTPCPCTSAARSPARRNCAAAAMAAGRLQAGALPLPLLQRVLRQDVALPLHRSGQVAGAAALRRGRDGRWQGEGRLHSDAGALRLDAASEREVFGYRALALDWRLDGGRLEAELDTGLAADGRITARLATGTDPAAALDGELDLDVRELTWLERFSEDLAAPAGRLHGRLQLAGTRAAPVLSGQAQLSGFQAELPALGLKLREGDFSLDGQADGSTRLNGAITSGDGRLQVAGELNLRDAQAPLLLALRGKAVTLANPHELHAL